MNSVSEGALKKIQKDERKAEKRESKKRAMLMRRINEQVQTIRIQAIALVLAFAVFLALSSSLNADMLRRFLSLVDPVPLGLRTAEEENFRQFPEQTYLNYAVQTYPNKCSYRMSNTCGHINCLGEMLAEGLRCLGSNDSIIYYHESSQFYKYEHPKAMLEMIDEDFWFDKNNILARAAVLIFRRIQSRTSYLESEMKINILIMAYIQRFFMLLAHNKFDLEATAVDWKRDCANNPDFNQLKENLSVFSKSYVMSDKPTAVIWFNKYDLNKIFLISPRGKPDSIQKTIQFVHKMHNQPNYVLALNGERRPLQKAISFLVRKHLYNDFYEKAIRYQQKAYFDFIESKYICERNSEIAQHLKSISIPCEDVDLNTVEEEDVFYSLILYHPPTQTLFTYENNVMAHGV
ncbi:unnamed protein product [Auanema sp. JU1783]|nr:unnamed protein product [Auanema sp. JU1783]